MGAEVDTGRKTVAGYCSCLRERGYEAEATLMDALLARAEAAELRAAEAVVATNKCHIKRMQAEREAREAEAQRDAAIAERDGLLAALREAHAALKMAREFGISSVSYHAMQSSVLGEWVDGGMRGPFPIYDSPFVRKYLEDRAALAREAPKP